MKNKDNNANNVLEQLNNWDPSKDTYRENKIDVFKMFSDKYAGDGIEKSISFKTKEDGRKTINFNIKFRI